MKRQLDNLLNGITMYRLVLYYLIVILVAAFVFSLLGILPYSAFSLMYSVLLLLVVGWLVNQIFAKTFNAPTNVESVYISALILALIITPPTSFSDVSFLFWAVVWTMASKFIFAIGKKHIFNPVAVSVLLLSFAVGKTATWWVGSISLLPFVLIGGYLLMIRIRREDLVISFIVSSLLTTFVFSLISGGSLLSTIDNMLLYSPLFFFAFVMLTEPLTTPPTKILRIVYGVFVGILFSPQFHIASFYTTPEMALVIGNVFSFLVSSKNKLVLQLNELMQISPDTFDFIFRPTQKFAYEPGQYMEWTLPHENTDSRGNRRYFTLASSPTEDELRLGVKFYPNSSSYKKSMLRLTKDKKVIAAQLSGDFTLPKNREQKCVFIAGGIGVTPFRSMIKFLLDKNQKRDIVLFYSNRHFEDIVYTDVFEQARRKLGIKTVYTLTDKENVPHDWWGDIGHIEGSVIRREVPDYSDRLFYLSGPQSMVNAFKDILHDLGVSKNMIKTDYFPGFS